MFTCSSIKYRHLTYILCTWSMFVLIDIYTVHVCVGDIITASGAVCKPQRGGMEEGRECPHSWRMCGVGVWASLWGFEWVSGLLLAHSLTPSLSFFSDTGKPCWVSSSSSLLLGLINQNWA